MLIPERVSIAVGLPHIVDAATKFSIEGRNIIPAVDNRTRKIARISLLLKDSLFPYAVIS